MKMFTYSVTDLTGYESTEFEISLAREDAIAFGKRMARELLNAMPELTLKGMCVAVYDPEGLPISIAPLGSVH